MNSTPAVSKARRTTASLAAVIDVSWSASSTRRMVATPTADSRARSALGTDAPQICDVDTAVLGRPNDGSAATNTCSGGKRDKLCLRWSRYGAAGDNRAAQPFHFRFEGRATFL